jgi:hypothetical protein
MDCPVKEHIDYLETRLRELNGTQLMENMRTQAERNHLQSEICTAELALRNVQRNRGCRARPITRPECVPGLSRLEAKRNPTLNPSSGDGR